jgi:predicted RNA-binding Zn-ribbon protein involved in translation (DUF1610 family)
MAQQNLTAANVRLILVMVACSVGVIGSFWLATIYSEWVYSEWVLVIAPGVFSGVMIWYVASDYRRCRRLRAKQFLACTKCEYDLSAHESAGNCPECGEAYTHDQIKRTWSKKCFISVISVPSEPKDTPENG